MGTALIDSLGQVFEPLTLLLMLVGVLVGFVVGILPGLGGAVALALMLPFTLDMDPVPAFAFLLGTLVVTSTTGDITSVLFGIPGEATSAATVLDGYPMTRRGEAGRALGIVLSSSAMGAVFGAAVLAAAIPFMRPLVLALGPPEFFMLTLIGLAFVIVLSGRTPLKGFVMAGLGLLVATVGLDPQTSAQRFTFGDLYLWDGINIVPVVIGLFGGAELLQLMLSKRSIAARGESTSEVNGVRHGLVESLRQWRGVVRASAIGAMIGVVPGLGGSVSQFIAYGSARQASKHPELFGHGSIEGLVAAGANNNAKDSGSLIPTVGFGVPGGVSSAMLLSAFLTLGLNPGPEMLTTHLDVTFSLVWITVLANFAAVLLALALLRPLTKLTFISGPVIIPFLIVVLALGSFTASNSYGDIVVMLVATAMGVFCIRWDWPRVPFLLAMVLGGIAERYLFLSHSLFGWAWFDRPVVILFFVALLLVVCQPLIRAVRARRGRRAVDVKDGAGR